MTRRVRAYTRCYAPAEVLDTSREPGSGIPVAQFGQHVAESAIFEDYVACTNQEPFLTVMLRSNPVDWTDKGSKGEYADFVKARNPRLDRDAFYRATTKWPDIVTHNGFVWPPGLPLPRPTLLTGALAMGVRAVDIMPRGRFEYYEIKPDSDTGRDDGIGKLAEIEPVMRDPRFRLRYVAGTTYPSPAQTRVDFPYDDVFRKLANDAIRRGRFTSVQVYLAVRRERPGLLLYKLCIELKLEDEDEANAEILAKAVAKHLFGTLIATTMPERYPETTAKLGDHSFEGDRVPKIKCRFDVLDALRPWTGRLSETIWSRGLASPGESYYVCCDENFYLNLVGPAYQGPTAESLWRQLRERALLWADVYGGKPATGLLEKEVIVKAEDVARLAMDAFPGLKPLADRIVRWIHEHPYETVAIVMLPLLLTTGLAVAVEAGLIGGALLTGELTGGEMAMVGGMGRMAAGRVVTTQAFGREAARYAAEETLRAASREAARQGARQAAQQATRQVVEQASKRAGEQIARQVGGKVIPFGRAAQQLGTLAKAASLPLVGGSVLMGYSVQARAATTPAAGGRAPGAEPQPGGGAAVPGTDPEGLIADDMSLLYLLRPLATPTTVQRLVPGALVDLNQIGQTTMASLPPTFPPRRLMAYYLGRVTIT
jgi:hypothetical protein